MGLRHQMVNSGSTLAAMFAAAVSAEPSLLTMMMLLFISHMRPSVQADLLAARGPMRNSFPFDTMCVTLQVGAAIVVFLWCGGGAAGLLSIGL